MMSKSDTIRVCASSLSVGREGLGFNKNKILTRVIIYINQENIILSPYIPLTPANPTAAKPKIPLSFFACCFTIREGQKTENQQISMSKSKLPTRGSRGSHEIDDYMDEAARFQHCQSLCLFEGQYLAYTDGSCWNSDPYRCGGSAYVVLNDKGRVIKAAHKGFKGTSSNRMEMLAIISALASIPQGSDLIFITDSQYSLDAFGEGYPAVRNQDLIRMFKTYRARLGQVQGWHIKGHNGTPLNEWCDYWSNFEYQAMRKKCKQKASESNNF